MGNKVKEKEGVKEMPHGNTAVCRDHVIFAGAFKDENNRQNGCFENNLVVS